MKNQYLTAEQLASHLGISKSNAYTKIAEMNSELKIQGYIVIPGKVPVKYANQKFYGVDFESKEEA